MTLLNILHYPDNKLRQKGEKVNTFDENLKKIANDMLETMYAAKGIGLAAVQVNLPIRLIVIDISETRNEPIIFEEGCLSVPGFYEKVERYNDINVTYNDIDGNTINKNTEGLLAVCIQHEIDHLDGKLFVDYISNLKRDRIAKKIKKTLASGSVPTRKDVPYNI